MIRMMERDDQNDGEMIIMMGRDDQNDGER